MKKVLIICAVLLGVSAATMGQTAPKFGHINSSELMGVMPERAAIQTELENYAKSLETQLQVMGTEYQSKVNDYQMNEKNWSDLVRESKAREIGDLENRIQEFQESAQKSLSEKEQSLVTPLIDKAQNGIKEVAKANGYTYVFDTSVGSVLVFPDSDNLLPLVKKHLGIQ
jgi:outer membrane protein